MDLSATRMASDEGAAPDVAGYSAEWASSAIASGELVDEIGRHSELGWAAGSGV